MNIQSFIFNWHNQFESTLKIEKQLNSIFNEVTVINSDEQNYRAYWKNIGEQAYFTHQFLTCLDLHDPEQILFHIQGDVSYDNWEGMVEDAKFYMNKYKAGIYYPKVKNVEWYDDDISTIQTLHAEDDNIKYVATGDETVWFIHPKIIKYLKNNKIHRCFSHSTTGWGWDTVLCCISHMLGMPVIRDSNHDVDHPKSTNYDLQLAFDEYDELKDKLPTEIAWYINHTTVTGKRFLFKKYLNLDELPLRK